MRARAARGICWGLVILASCAGRSSAPLSTTPAAAGPGEPAEVVEPAEVAEPVVSPVAVEPAEPPPAAGQDPPTTVAEPREPNPYIAPPVRQAGDLTVEAPPRERSNDFRGRLRTHVEGALSKGSPRVWVGPQVPGFVPLMEQTAELFLLDRVGDEFMAFYRDPYGASSCGLGEDANCHYFVRLYDLEGNERWRVSLHELLSAPTYLEVQDIRWADGTLYFNEACRSYASGAGGKCSALVAYDPVESAVRWRTRPLVSNGAFLIHGDYIVAGYGFTNERDFIYVVRRSDGKIMQKLSVPKSPEHFAMTEDGQLEVTLYPGTLHLFALRGWDGAKPRLEKLARPKATGRTTAH